MSPTSSSSASPASQPSPPAWRTLRLLAPAKINLHLRVGPARPDGFHPLLTWMCTVGLFDTLKVEAAPERGSSGAPPTVAGAAGAVSLTCDPPGLPCDAGNIVVRVALAWQAALRTPVGTGFRLGAEATERERSGTEVDIIRMALGKRIPVGAGLGGGSSDAARALLALDRLSGTNRSTDALSAFAARFGSDLSFFVHAASAVCTGRGEVVRAIARPAPRWTVLLLPPLEMPTGPVYRRFDEMKLGRDDDVSREPDWTKWVSLDAAALLPRLANDLEPAAFALAPQLGGLRGDAERLLARPVRMSGSGSSLFTLYDDEAAARAAAEAVSASLHVRAEAVEVAPIFADDLNGPSGDR